MFLVDTDVLIWALRGRQPIIQLLARLRQEVAGPLAASVISVFEVWAGRHESEEQVTAEFLAELTHLAIDDEVALRAAELARFDRARGDSPSVPDLFIAAAALANDLILVTYNSRHFDYPEVKVYAEMPPLT